MHSNIVSHQNPDWDSITSTWLLSQHGGMKFKFAEWRFVNTGNPDKEVLAGGSAVVDTGQVYDLSRLRFDHHHLPPDQANETCATSQVFGYLMDLYPEKVAHLSPLVDLVFAGDTGRKEANFSRELGLHALLSAFKSKFKEVHGTFAPDKEVMDWGFHMLDLMDFRLKAQAGARAELSEKTVYKSDDSKVWAIKYGSVGSGFAAQERGAILTVFEGEPIKDQTGQIISCPVGVMRAGENSHPHVGNLIGKVIEKVTDPDIKEELASWYRHPAGFFAGRGTAKAMDPRPVKVNLAEVAGLIDRERE